MAQQRSWFFSIFTALLAQPFSAKRVHCFAAKSSFVVRILYNLSACFIGLLVAERHIARDRTGGWPPQGPFTKRESARWDPPALAARACVSGLGPLS
jgi:hypothetical protein